jgi:hypothetical protein
MDAGKVVVWVFGATIAGLTAYNFRYEIGDLLHFERREISAEITLDNRCEFRDSVMIVRDQDTDAFAKFYGGVAILKTKERNRVRLEFDPKYDDVEFFGTEFPAQKKMTLIADCKNARKYIFF